MCICEGFATGASVYEATGHAVAIAFDAGNLLPVARALRGRFPDLSIVIAADNDASATGQRAAQAAALTIGAFVAIPAAEGDDWNDVARRDGIEAVRSGIAQAGAVKPMAPEKAPNVLLEGAEWPAPVPFDSLVTPEIPPELLPDPVGAYVSALCNYCETPPALGVMVALAVLSVAARGRLQVEVHGGHREPVTLYTVVALQSGNRKTSVFPVFPNPSLSGNVRKGRCLVRWLPSSGAAARARSRSSTSAGVACTSSPT